MRSTLIYLQKTYSFTRLILFCFFLNKINRSYVFNYTRTTLPLFVRDYEQHLVYYSPSEAG